MIKFKIDKTLFENEINIINVCSDCINNNLCFDYFGYANEFKSGCFFYPHRFYSISNKNYKRHCKKDCCRGKH
jgi:hypothetical protein